MANSDNFEKNHVREQTDVFVLLKVLWFLGPVFEVAPTVGRGASAPAPPGIDCFTPQPLALEPPPVDCRMEAPSS